MKILHLFSNWKWTGPAELAVNLAVSLTDQHAVTFICGTPPKKKMENEVAREARARGILPKTGFRLSKHLNFTENVRDAMKLRAFLKKAEFDLIHTHMPNDHLLGGLASRRLKKMPIVIRSFYGAAGPEENYRSWFYLKRFTDGAIVMTRRGHNRIVEEYEYSEKRIATIPVGIDTERFNPRRFNRLEARRSLGLDRDDFLLCIVARMQKHRKFEILLQAMKQVMAAQTNIKLVIIGRGTNQEEVARQPVREMGLEDRILFTGYLSGEKYVEALAAMDAAVFLVPGSDGSCRAVREKMAMGLPVIGADTPPLDEMITSGRTGYLVKVTPEAIAHAALYLARNPEDLVQMSHSTCEFGQRAFSLEYQAEQVNRFYEKIMAKEVN